MHFFPLLFCITLCISHLDRIDVHGEMDAECARAYYEYGNALLMKEEDNPSDDLLGAAAKEARKAAASLASIFAVSVLLDLL